MNAMYCVVSEGGRKVEGADAHEAKNLRLFILIQFFLFVYLLYKILC